MSAKDLYDLTENWQIAIVERHREYMNINMENEDWELNDDDGEFHEREWSFEDAASSLMSECGRTEEGFCMFAGSEQCDFDCPFR